MVESVAQNMRLLNCMKIRQTVLSLILGHRRTDGRRLNMSSFFFLLRKERLISRGEVIGAEENHIVMRFVLLFTPFVRVFTQ